MNVDFCLKKNLISEKGTILYNNNCYLFYVYNTANKIMIKKCIENYFNVKVKAVNIINTLSKKATRYYKGYQTNRKVRSVKKALVYLFPGEVISFSDIK